MESLKSKLYYSFNKPRFLSLLIFLVLLALAFFGGMVFKERLLKKAGRSSEIYLQDGDSRSEYKNDQLQGVCIYPWTNNGPTAGWKSDKSNLINTCNGKWCWKWDDNLGQWSNNGIPVDISQGWASQIQAASDGTLPWTNNGPTAGWKSDKYNLIAACNGKWCWNWDDNLGQWANNGVPQDLSQIWGASSNHPVEAASDGTLPWTNNGPTAGWKSDRSSLVNICNGKWCWKWDDNLGQWSNNGIPVDISQGWASQIQPGGCEIPPSPSPELTCELSEGFSGEAKVTMSDGATKEIKNISAGDKVLVYNSGTGNFNEKEVRGACPIVKNNYYKLEIAGLEPILVSNWMGFFIRREGREEHANAKEIKVGDMLLTRNQNGGLEYKQVISNEEVKEPITVYYLASSEFYYGFVVNGVVGGKPPPPPPPPSQ
jgi:hypothetical protein